MANQAKSVANSRQNLSRAQREAREQAEQSLIKQTKPKQNAVVKANAAMKSIFNQIKKYNDHFTAADSISLNTLTYNLYLKAQNEEHLSTLHHEDDQYERYMARIEKFNKQITESMKQLCIPLNTRMTLANEMAKVLVEEKKLEQMEAQNTAKTNPLLDMLEEDEDDE